MVVSQGLLLLFSYEVGKQVVFRDILSMPCAAQSRVVLDPSDSSITSLSEYITTVKLQFVAKIICCR